MCRGGCRSVCKRTLGAENGDMGCDWGNGVHWRTEVLTAGRGDEDVVRVDGDVLMEWGEEEGVENFLSDLGGSGRHR